MKQKIPLILKSLGIDYVTEYKFHPSRKWRFDWAVPDKMVAIEYEGVMSTKARHTSITGYTKDAEKYNQAVILGWKVLRYTALSSEKQVAEDLLKLF